MTCPDCGGNGRAFQIACGGGRCTTGVVECRMCSGAGTISEAHAARIEAGQALRADRVARRVNQREEAARLGITPQELAGVEAGRVSLAEVKCG